MKKLSELERLGPNPKGDHWLKYLDVKTQYRDKLIRICNVPVYEYATGQVKISRKTRIKIRSLLKKTYEIGDISVVYR